MNFGVSDCFAIQFTRIRTIAKLTEPFDWGSQIEKRDRRKKWWMQLQSWKPMFNIIDQRIKLTTTLHHFECVCRMVHALFNDKRLLLWFDSIISIQCTLWMRRIEQSIKQIALNIKLALGDSSELLLQNNSEWLPCLRCVHSHKMLKAWTFFVLLFFFFFFLFFACKL